MKIITTDKSAYNKTVRYINNILIKWDEKGESDQPEEIANILTSQYDSVLTEEGYKNREIVEKDNKKVDIKLLNKIDELSALIQSKQEALDHSNRILAGEKMIRKDLESEITVLRQAAKALEDKVSQLVDENKELKLVIEKGFKKESDKSLREKLTSKKKDELIDYCVELDLNQEEYKDLNKSDLINYIIQKVEDANN